MEFRAAVLLCPSTLHALVEIGLLVLLQPIRGFHTTHPPPPSHAPASSGGLSVADTCYPVIHITSSYYYSI